jgi:hypothetical protein
MLVEDVLQRSSGTFLVSTAWMMRSLGHPRCFPAHRSYEKKHLQTGELIMFFIPDSKVL